MGEQEAAFLNPEFIEVAQMGPAEKKRLVMGDGFLISRRELAELGDGRGDGLQGEINVGLCAVTAQAEAQAGARFFGGQADGGEHV